MLGGSDPEGSPVSVASVGLPCCVGTLSGSGSQRCFTPPDGFLGILPPIAAACWQHRQRILHAIAGMCQGDFSELS